MVVTGRGEGGLSLFSSVVCWMDFCDFILKRNILFVCVECWCKYFCSPAKFHLMIISWFASTSVIHCLLMVNNYCLFSNKYSQGKRWSVLLLWARLFKSRFNTNPGWKVDFGSNFCCIKVFLFLFEISQCLNLRAENISIKPHWKVEKLKPKFALILD